MSHAPAVTAVAASLALAVAALAAPPTGRPTPAAALAAPQLTREQVNKLPAGPGAPRALRVSPAGAVAAVWRGPDLVVEPPPMGMVGHPADAQCANYLDLVGAVYYWGVRNAGGQPTTGKATVTLSCDVMPASLPAATRQAWDQRLCGCMRKVFANQVPALAPGQIYGKQPQERTMLTFTSFPDPFPTCGDATMPHAKVVVRVVPRPEEGSAVGNNDRTVEFCIP